MNNPKREEYFICGGFGGICAILVGHPLDTIKVRLQTMPIPKQGESALYAGAWDCFQKILQNEGFKGLYKGMSFPLICVAPIFALSFVSYGVGKEIFGPPNIKHISQSQLFAAGAFSGFFSALVTTPGDRIKCLLQIQQISHSPKLYNGAVDCVRKLYKQGGILSIYRGMVATMLREIPGSGIYFVTYENLRERIAVDNSGLSKKLKIILAGGSAGVAYWLIGLPADVIKSRIQTSSDIEKIPTIRTALKDLLHKEGPFALYRGFSPVLVRAFLSNGACFLGFDLCREFLGYYYYSEYEPSSNENVQPVGQKPDKG